MKQNKRKEGHDSPIEYIHPPLKDDIGTPITSKIYESIEPNFKLAGSKEIEPTIFYENSIELIVAKEKKNLLEQILKWCENSSFYMEGELCSLNVIEFEELKRFLKDLKQNL